MNENIRTIIYCCDFIKQLCLSKIIKIIAGNKIVVEDSSLRQVQYVNCISTIPYNILKANLELN